MKNKEQWSGEESSGQDKDGDHEVVAEGGKKTAGQNLLRWEIRGREGRRLLEYKRVISLHQLRDNLGPMFLCLLSAG